MSQGSPTKKKIKAQKKPRPPRKITKSYLHNAGLYYLERFAASSAHFHKVMMRKIDRSCAFHKEQNRDECIKELEQLIVKFQNVGLLNDAAYARGMVQSLRRRGLAARMIQAKLRAKGLEQDEIASALHAHAEDLDEDAELLAALKMARRKKIGPYATTEKPFDKALAAMARAGFNYDMAQKVLRMNLEEAEEISGTAGY